MKGYIGSLPLALFALFMLLLHALYAQDYRFDVYTTAGKRSAAALAYRQWEFKDVLITSSGDLCFPLVHVDPLHDEINEVAELNVVGWCT